MGSSVAITGSLCTTHAAQTELHPDGIEIIGACDSIVSCHYELFTCSLFEMHIQEYPFKAHGRHPLEYLRHFPHLRPKTREFASLLRIRNTATMAVHEFFQVHAYVPVLYFFVKQTKGYLHVHTPIITSCDCEGAGETFVIKVKTTLFYLCLLRNDLFC